MTKSINTTSSIIFDKALLTRFASDVDASDRTVDTYKKALRQLIRFFSFHGITSPKRSDILSFKDWLEDEGKRPATIQAYITAARIFFRWLAGESLYPDITDKIKGAKLSRTHKKDYLTSDQVKTVLSNIDTSSLQGARDYAIATLMITGGLRTVEIVRADIEDLRALGGGTVLYIQGKGRTEKTDYVKVPPPVETAIRAYLAKRGKTEGKAPLFASLSNNSKGGRMSTRAISGMIKDRLIKSGFNSERLTAHSLRHTAVTLSLLSGRGLDEVQQFARHSNITTTMIYNHALDKAQNKCSEAVSNAIFNNQAHENNHNRKSKRGDR